MDTFIKENNNILLSANPLIPTEVATQTAPVEQTVPLIFSNAQSSPVVETVPFVFNSVESAPPTENIPVVDETKADDNSLFNFGDTKIALFFKKYIKKSESVETLETLEAPVKTEAAGKEDLSIDIPGWSVIKTEKTVEAQEKDGLADAIPGWYVLKDDTARQNQLNTHLAKFENEGEQLAEIERFIEKGVTETDFKLLAGTHKALLEGNVVIAMDKIVNVEGSQEKKTMAGIAVAKEIKNMDAEFQFDVSKIIVATENKELIEVGAQDVSALDKTVQVETHSLYFETNNVDVQRILTEQYGQYDADCEVEIHQTTMGSEYQEILNLGSQYIYKLNAENQTAATQITMNTGNKEAIGSFVNYSHLCDESVQSEIQNIIVSSGYKVPERPAEQSSGVGVSTVEPKTAQSNMFAVSVEKEEEEFFKTATLSEKIEMIQSSNSLGDKYLIKDIIKNASKSEKIALISMLSPGVLISLVNTILSEDSSLQIISEITKTLGRFERSDKKELMEKLGDRNSLGMFSSSVKFLDSDSQKTFISCLAKKDELNSINKQELSKQAGILYTELSKNKRNQW